MKMFPKMFEAQLRHLRQHPEDFEELKKAVIQFSDYLKEPSAAGLKELARYAAGAFLLAQQAAVKAASRADAGNGIITVFDPERGVQENLFFAERLYNLGTMLDAQLNPEPL